jgi:hypothetical protein
LCLVAHGTDGKVNRSPEAYATMHRALNEGYGRYPAKFGCGTRQHGAASRLERSQRNPNGARAIRGKQVSNVIRAHKAKGSVKTRRLIATWSPEFLLKVLSL